jgi:hypothetical protein
LGTSPRSPPVVSDSPSVRGLPLRAMNGDIGSMRFSSDRQMSMKFSTRSMPWRSMWRRTRVAWFAMPSIILRLVFEKK